MAAGTDLMLPPMYKFTPLKALRSSTRKKIAQYLDLEGTLVVCGDIDVENNYNGLAELAGFTYLDIRNLMRARSPTIELLDQWTTKETVSNATVGELWDFLFTMERIDILHDCRRNILNDCRIYDEQIQIQIEAEKADIEYQDPTVSNSDMKVDETECCTIDDSRNKTQTMYDAFICYTQECPEDVTFVKGMIAELETNRGLKLFVPGRDDLPGAAMYVINAYLIEMRCKRVVILMSEAFLNSPICDFQVKFAHALAPGARSKKLIPVIREKKTRIPRILRFLSVCDFTKSDMQDWVWERLAMAINAPFQLGNFAQNNAQPAQEVDLKDIPFPTTSPSKSLFGSSLETSSNGQSTGYPEPQIVYQRQMNSSAFGATGSRSGHPAQSHLAAMSERNSAASSTRNFMSMQTSRSSNTTNNSSLPIPNFSARGRGVPVQSAESVDAVDSSVQSPTQSIQIIQNNYTQVNSMHQISPSMSHNPRNYPQNDSAAITSTVHYV